MKITLVYAQKHLNVAYEYSDVRWCWNARTSTDQNHLNVII